VRRVVLLLAVVSAAGCGGGDGRLSKQEFDAKANAVCGKYQGRIDAVPEPKNLDDVPGYVDKIVPLIEKGTSEIDDLKPPEDLQDTYDDWRATQQRLLQKARDLKAAAQDNDAGRAQQVLREAGRASSRVDALARQLGANKCAED
jgi:hypothetical protein